MLLGASLVLFIWGVIAFHNLPIEAYPDVADTYVQIVTQWPGHAAEEVEQQITVPLEVSLNGVAHMTICARIARGLSQDHAPLRRPDHHVHRPPGSARPAAAAHTADECKSGIGAGLQSDRADPCSTP